MIRIDERMPKSCMACRLIKCINGKEWTCLWTGRNIAAKDIDRKDPFCPLKEEAVCPDYEGQLQGEWLEDGDNENVRKLYFCSVCGKDSFGVYEKTKYCPDCGAKMNDPGERKFLI